MSSQCTCYHVTQDPLLARVSVLLAYLHAYALLDLRRACRPIDDIAHLLAHRLPGRTQDGILGQTAAQLREVHILVAHTPMILRVTKQRDEKHHPQHPEQRGCLHVCRMKPCIAHHLAKKGKKHEHYLPRLLRRCGKSISSAPSRSPTSRRRS